MTKITIRDLGYSYARTPLFHKLNFSACRGEAIGILGSNGAGKTTLFDLICNLRKPDAGTLTNNACRQLYLSQTLSPPPGLRMQEIHALITHLDGDKPRSAGETFKCMERWSVPLYKRYAALWNKKPANCSYGEIRSFFTLTLLVMQGDLLILDEPTAGVDPDFRHYIWLAIRKACAEGATVLVSSHHIQEITANCDRFYMLAQRTLQEFSSAEHFMTHHDTECLDEAFILASSKD